MKQHTQTDKHRPVMVNHLQGNETTAPRIQSERGRGDHAQIWKQHPPIVDYLVNHLQGNEAPRARGREIVNATATGGNNATATATATATGEKIAIVNATATGGNIATATATATGEKIAIATATATGGNIATATATATGEKIAIATATANNICFIVIAIATDTRTNPVTATATAPRIHTEPHRGREITQTISSTPDDAPAIVDYLVNHLQGNRSSTRPSLTTW